MATIDQIPVQLTAPATNDRLVARDTSANLDRYVELAQLFDISLRSDVLLVDANFSTYSLPPNRYTTIATAMAAATPGQTVLVAPGIYTEDVIFNDDRVKLVGSGQPKYDSATGRLVGGTIIRGEIGMSNKIGLTISNLGVDLFGVDSVDCISGTTEDLEVHRRFENLTLLGNGYDALSHGLYGNGTYGYANNCHIIDCHHGMAVHGSHWNISNMHFYRCSGTSLILKSKGVGDVHHVNISNILLEGDPTGADFKLYAGPLMLQADDVADSVRFINIANVAAEYCQNGVIMTQVINSGVVVSDISMVNVSSRYNFDLSNFGDFWFRQGSNISLWGCKSFDRDSGVGFNLDPAGSATKVRIYGATSDTSGSGSHTSGFDVMEMNGLRERKEQFVTIASGAITITSEQVVVDTEAAASTDDLTTINGGKDGMVIILRSDAAARDVVIKNGTGNIRCGADRTLSDNRDIWSAKYIAGISTWVQVSFSDNL